MAALMNKHEMVDTARAMARRDNVAESKTLEEIQAMTWNDRETLARQLARDAASGIVPGWNTKYAEAFLEAYRSAVENVWSTKTYELEQKRQTWQRATRGLTYQEAADKIKALITSFNLRGVKPNGGLDVTVERAWGYGASLYVRIERTDVRIENPDDVAQRAGTYTVTTKLSWSSTGRSIAESVAATKLYTELIEVAAEVEAVMLHEHIYWTYGVPEKEVAKTLDTSDVMV